MTDVACFLNSSTGPGPSDAAKDRRALAWLGDFSGTEQRFWNERCWLIRWIDRAVEEATLNPAGCGWCNDCADAIVAAALATGIEQPPYGYGFHHFRLAVKGYVGALGAYARPMIVELAHHDAMLLQLGGGAFRLLPYFGVEHWAGVAAFGALDQFWNNVRDLTEDLGRGVCYFPRHYLGGHYPSRYKISDPAICRSGVWACLMRFWLDHYEPQVRARAQPFIEATGLHPSWQRFRAERLAEYARIERVFREVEYDYVAFGERYWRET